MKAMAWLASFSCVFAGAFVFSVFAQDGLKREIPEAQLKSGSQFQLPETRALQNDDFANPGLLWLEQGKELWAAPAGKENISCASCHGAEGKELVGAATRYPAYDAEEKRLVNLEQRINICRRKHQQADELAYESDGLLSLTALIAIWSSGQPYSISIDGPAQEAFEAGRTYYYTRRGQLNLSCTQCHDQNWGQMLRGDKVSQGHPIGYPAYRFTWERLGSLHQRIRDCDVGVRAEPFDYGADEYISLELYLAWRAGELPFESPAVRR